MTHPSLRHPPVDFIGGEPRPLSSGGLVSTNPARPSEVLWSGQPVLAHVQDAVCAARTALPAWSRWSREQRFAVLRRFQQLCVERVEQVADCICDETGKARWDALSEAKVLAGKVDITLDESPGAPLARVTGFETSLTDSREGRCWFKPHGVMAVIGPFNFPAHLPNGHIVPALATGNTVVFKPSDKTPATGQLLTELLHEALDEAGAPPGVVNLVQGAADVAKALTTHDDIDGILFTGSWPVGRKILQASLDRPGRIIALELGGNNPHVVLPDADLRQAAIETVRSAFITTGQRCTAARRLIVHEAIADPFLAAICKAASNLIVGEPRAEHPVFMGPPINADARDALAASFKEMLEAGEGAGGTSLLDLTAFDDEQGAAYVTPGIVQVDRFTPSVEQASASSVGQASGLSQDAGCDIEVFGPLLRVAIVSSIDDAIAQANATRYGLASAIFTHDRDAIERFLAQARAGCVNVNTGTAGASSKLPFGGLGLSGNHRPAGAFSLDYCAYPVAGMIESGPAAPLPTGMTFDDSWL